MLISVNRILYRASFLAASQLPMNPMNPKRIWSRATPGQARIKLNLAPVPFSPVNNKHCSTAATHLYTKLTMAQWVHVAWHQCLAAWSNRLPKCQTHEQQARIVGEPVATLVGIRQTCSSYRSPAGRSGWRAPPATNFDAATPTSICCWRLQAHRQPGWGPGKWRTHHSTCTSATHTCTTQAFAATSRYGEVLGTIMQSYFSWAASRHGHNGFTLDPALH